MSPPSPCRFTSIFCFFLPFFSPTHFIDIKTYRKEASIQVHRNKIFFFFFCFCFAVGLPLILEMISLNHIFGSIESQKILGSVHSLSVWMKGPRLVERRRKQIEQQEKQRKKMEMKFIQRKRKRNFDFRIHFLLKSMY